MLLIDFAAMQFRGLALILTGIRISNTGSKQKLQKLSREQKKNPPKIKERSLLANNETDSINVINEACEK